MASSASRTSVLAVIWGLTGSPGSLVQTCSCGGRSVPRIEEETARLANQPASQWRRNRLHLLMGGATKSHGKGAWPQRGRPDSRGWRGGAYLSSSAVGGYKVQQEPGIRCLDYLLNSVKATYMGGF